MSWDIYGNPLRRGYCEVHPDVHQEYPCSICMAQKQQQSQPHNELEQLQYEFAQQGDYIRHLESERAALAAQVDSLLDNCKAFVKKEFQLLKEIERLEIELKKRDEQNAALAAQVHVLNTAAGYILNARKPLAKRRAYAALADAVNKTPEHHLRELRAEAGRDGFIQGASDAAAYIATQLQSGATDINLELAPPADKYAETIRQGGAE